MCGICGIATFNGEPVLRDHLEKMNLTLAHRGPDGAGIFLDDDIGLGHRRLSIIDLQGGHQPMGTSDGSYQVVFNGEIYNFLELKADLSGRGHDFRTRSDTESILHGYAEWGEDVVKQLRGMFAFALWDKREKKLILARDRLGKKPLYYYHDGQRIAFASELKAILQLPHVTREIDPFALDAYLSFGYVPSPMSIFKHIKKLEPAQILVCSRSGLNIRPYWHLEMDGTIAPLSIEAAMEELMELFDECVRLRLISDVPLGAFLSGGVDSSAVVASMARQLRHEPVKTASIGFSEERFDELRFARKIASLYQTDHSEFVVDPKAVDIIEQIVWHFDEPFADSSAIPTYYVSQMARQKVTVALSGDGGDETFAGYTQRYQMNRFEANIRKKIPSSMRRHVLPPLARAYPRVDFLPRPLRLKTFLTNLSRSFEDAYFRDMSFYFQPEMKSRLYRPEMKDAVKDFKASDILGRHFADNRNPDPTTRVQYIDIKTYMTEDILVKVDRMSMAHSLEVRSPILDHRLMEYVGRLPSEWKFWGAESKYIFKKINEKRLPRDILYRRKQGFRIPLSDWMRGDLRELAHETLFSSNDGIRDYFNVDYIRKLWERHQSGMQDTATPLWGLMMFGLWHKTYMHTST
jgi:asparagine synthase (glutamine-hydrolysing)